MTTSTTVYCKCGDRRSKHLRGKSGCQAMGCGCARFEEHYRVAHAVSDVAALPSDSPAAVATSPEVYGAYDSYWCSVCGSRYQEDGPHGCGSLIPVTVTITARTAR